MSRYWRAACWAAAEVTWLQGAGKELYTLCSVLERRVEKSVVTSSM